MTNAIESLRIFALAHNEMAFAHLCIAALNGEAFADDRVQSVLAQIDAMAPDVGDRRQAALEIIRSTDTTRPDGAIARKLVNW